MAAEAGLVAASTIRSSGSSRLLAGYRTQLVTTECTYGCPIGSLALELHEPDPRIRELLSVNFANWTSAIERCLDAAGERLPAALDRRRLAEFTLTVMEGAIMQARTYRDIDSFDRNIAVLREHFDMLIETAQERAACRPERIKRGGKSCLKSIISPSCSRRVSAFVLGGLWYSPALFAKKWMAYTGHDARARSSNRAIWP